MADSSQPRREGPQSWGFTARRSMVTLMAVVLLGAVAPGGPPPMPMLVPERPRSARIRASLLAAARTPAAARRWGRLLRARPAIGTAPTSRTANPVLPTVGRPRDGPRPGLPSVA
ncbi:MAG TPA: hypothetical protein VH299_14240 [Solirubrobacterales bacterium]|nr:hypothetical protein [Solirubrobacterales bacterium]